MILSMPTDERNILILSPLCAVCITSSRLFVSEEEFERCYDGESKRKVFPELPDSEVEVLISGTHPECWAEMFSGDDE